MIRAPIPPNDADRLAALERFRVLDTPPEPRFDRVAELAAKVLGVPVVLVSLVDRTRQWFKSRYGLAASETPRDVSFCGHAVAADAPLVVPDARLDPRFADNPLVTGEPYVIAYAGAPLRSPDGYALGTLCAIDHSPRQFTEHELAILAQLGQWVVLQLEQRREQLEREAALRDAHIALRVAQEELRALFDGMGEGVVAMSVDAGVTHWNATAERILGMDGALLKGLAAIPSGWQVWTADGTPMTFEAMPAMVALRTGKPVRDALWFFEGPQRKRTWISASAQPIFHEGAARPHAVVATLRDVTGQRLAEGERDQMREQLARQKWLVMAGTLAAGVGHEVNNPLSAVTSEIDYSLEILHGAQDALPPARFDELRQALAEARAGAERIRQIVRTLRTLARDDGDLGPIRVATAVELALQLVGQEVCKRATVRSDLPEVPRVLAEESRLAQAFVNVLVNAAQAFTRADPATNHVTLRARVEGAERVVVEVADDGPGIAADIMPRIFDPFFTTKEVGVGAGLGLSIAHNLVTSMGGGLTCASSVGEGTVIRFELRVAPTAPGRSEVRSLAEGAGGRA